MNEREELNVIDLFKNLLQYMNMGHGELKALISAVKAVMDSNPEMDTLDHAKVRIDEVATLLKALAVATKTETDDGIVDFVNKFLSDEDTKTMAAVFLLKFFGTKKELSMPVDWEKLLNLLSLAFQVCSRLRA